MKQHLTIAKKRQSFGQVMPIALFGSAALVLGLFLVFNTSQLSSKKQRLNNAADAATYSASVFKARALNSIAYSNRAMIANQVYVGQLVSLENYINFWQVKAKHLSYVPYVSFFATPVNKGIKEFQKVSTPVIGLAVQEAMNTNRFLSVAQKPVALAAIAGQLEVIEEVLRANDENIHVSEESVLFFRELANNATKIIQTKGTEADKIRKAEMIRKSRDRFTQSRNYTDTLINIGFAKARLRKEGTTDLQYLGEDGSKVFSWESADALTFELDYRFRKKRIPVAWSKRYASQDGKEVECGGGGALSGYFDRAPPKTEEEMRALEAQLERYNKSEDGTVKDEDGVVQENLSELPDYWDVAGGNCGYQLTSKQKKAELLANLREKESIKNPNGSNLKLVEIQDFQELADDVEKDARFPITLIVEYDDSDIKTTNNIKTLGSPSKNTSGDKELDSGTLWQQPDTLKNKMHAISRAEVFFRRPVKRTVNKYGAASADEGPDEFANVWNPYWGARLLDTSEQRLAARLAMGLTE